MYEDITVTPKENSQVEITGMISPAALAPFRQKALEKIGQTAKIPGFRQGHIPEQVLVEKVGEAAILENAAELALQTVVPELVEKHAAQYIARPKITITKLAPNNPLGFSILVAVRPTLQLPDYKKIAAEEIAASNSAAEQEKIVVSDKEVADVIEHMRSNYAHQELHKHTEAHHDDTAANHNHTDAELEKHKPEITDDFVKTLGNFNSVADFREKIKENLLQEKKQRHLEKRRAKILEKLLAETKFPVPQPLIDYELNRMVGQFEEDVRRLGLSVDSYLSHIKKTREDIQKEWLPEAEKRARTTLILEEIARKENLRASSAEIEQEVRRLKSQHADLDTAQVEGYVSHILTLEKTIAFLETTTVKG